MKIVHFIKYFFLLSGLGMMIGAFFLYQNTQEFIKDSVLAQGKVIELIRHISEDSEGYISYTYRPQVEFLTPEGEINQFESNMGSNPPAYRVNEAVEVVYLTNAPEQAKINSFTSLWLLPLILAGIGFLNIAIGLGMIVYTRIKKKQRDWLQQFGRRVQSQFKSVELNTSYKINGRSPYRIFSQLDEAGQVCIFKSENLWFDPSSYLQKDQEITVLVDPQNMKKYVMDLSFLPELKN